MLDNFITSSMFYTVYIDREVIKIGFKRHVLRVGKILPVLSVLILWTC